MRTSYIKDGETIGVGEIDSLPGCTQLAVFHSAFVLPQYRGKAHGTNAHWRRLDKARELGYNAAICTVSANNLHQIEVLKKCGWDVVATFKSTKTENTVQLWFRPL